MAYARECLIAFVQMKVSKAELIRQLDRAMIDPSALPELEASFRPVVHK
jgi:hypothetical protein